MRELHLLFLSLGIYHALQAIAVVGDDLPREHLVAVANRLEIVLGENPRRTPAIEIGERHQRLLIIILAIDSRTLRR